MILYAWLLVWNAAMRFVARGSRDNLPARDELLDSTEQSIYDVTQLQTYGNKAMENLFKI